MNFTERIRVMEAIFALFVASGLCLTFSVITAIYAIRTLENSRQFLYFAWDLIHDPPESSKLEGTKEPE